MNKSQFDYIKQTRTNTLPLECACTFGADKLKNLEEGVALMRDLDATEMRSMFRPGEGEIANSILIICVNKIDVNNLKKLKGKKLFKKLEDLTVAEMEKFTYKDYKAQMGKSR